MNKEQINKSRGEDLLVPLGIEHEQVHSLVLKRDVFKTVAAAKQWVRNHGFVFKSEPSLSNEAFSFFVGEGTNFESGSLKTEKLNRSVVANVGAVIKSKNADDEPKQEPEVAQEPEISAPDEVVAVKKRGEVFTIQKQAEDDGVRVIGIVAMPETPDVEGDVISEEEIRQANDLFMREFGTMGFMHQKDVSDVVKIIQNVIAPIDIDFPLEDGTTKLIKKGTWYQELYTAEPSLVDKIRKGQITGLSLGGFAKREPINAEDS